jgi:inorganic phosphate transporter, PiT family
VASVMSPVATVTPLPAVTVTDGLTATIPSPAPATAEQALPPAAAV